ncbi:MAG: hypothetical protein MUP16_04885 [Sedimentisphaerales bacterium]|nr:hypothetical protein [Sedimentisphaerales bacterium]
MMNCNEILWHLDVPVCQTRGGVREHIKAIGMNWAWRLCFALKCDGPDSLANKLWDMIKRRRRIKRQDK